MARRRDHLFWVAAGILLAIGGLVVANLLAFNPKNVKEALEQDLAEYQLIPEADVLKRDVFLHGLLNNESYREHAKARYRDVERLHPRVHGAADLELEAKKAVPPFLAQCRDLSKVPPGEVRRLYDESRTHLANYATTQQAAPLREAQGRLRALLEKQDRIDPEEIIKLQKEVRKAVDGGRFVEAMQLIADFRKRLGSVEYDRQIRETEEMVSRMSAAAVKPR